MDACVIRALVSLALCFSNHLSHAYPTGAPTAACNTLLPSHGNLASPLGYGIEAGQGSFFPGNQVSFSVTFPSDLTSFLGVIVQVRNSADEKVGTFEESLDFKTITCGSAGNTLTHRNSDEKSSGTFLWIAPSSCADGEEFTLKATIVNSYSEFQVDIESATLTCNTPPKSTPQCTHSNLTSIPMNGYATSFEAITFPSIWNNTGSASRWSRRMGGTPSTGTGPDGAADGDYYMYFETSAPRVTGDTVVLATADTPDLRGCFCLMLQLSFNVDVGHRFEIFVGDNSLYTAAGSHGWKAVKVQVDTDEFVQIRMVGTRGSNWRGDMAVDDISIVAGLCP